MDISFAELKEKEIINVCDGKKLGHIIDIVFDNENGIVRGIIVPGERKLFKKSDDIFIPLEKLKRIGDDVVLIKLQVQNRGSLDYQNNIMIENSRYNLGRNDDNYYEYRQPKNRQISSQNRYVNEKEQKNIVKGQSQSNNKSFVRFKPINNIKYK